MMMCVMTSHELSNSRENQDSAALLFPSDLPQLSHAGVLILQKCLLSPAHVFLFKLFLVTAMTREPTMFCLL